MSSKQVVSIESNDSIATLGDGVRSTNMSFSDVTGANLKKEIYDHIHTGGAAEHEIRFNTKKNILNLFKDTLLERQFCSFYYTKNYLKFKLFIVVASVLWTSFLVMDITNRDIYATNEFFYLNIGLRLFCIPIQICTFILLFIKKFSSNPYFVDILFLIAIVCHTVATSIMSNLDTILDTFPAGSTLTILCVVMCGTRTYVLFPVVVLTLISYTVSFLLVKVTFRVIAWQMVLGFGFFISLTLSVTLENKFRALFLVTKKHDIIRKQISVKNKTQSSILHNVLPKYFVSKINNAQHNDTDNITLRQGEQMTRSVFQERQNMTVILSDFVGFTTFAAQKDAKSLITRINGYFTIFDRLAEEHQLEKIKTIGDAYFACDYNSTGGKNCVIFGLNLLKALDLGNRMFGEDLHIRIGIVKGPCMVVVLGDKMLSFDVLGESVVEVEKFEKSCEVNTVHISSNLHNHDQFHVRKNENGPGWTVTGIKEKDGLQPTNYGFIKSKLSENGSGGGLRKVEQTTPKMNESELGDSTNVLRMSSTLNQSRSVQRSNIASEYRINYLLSIFFKKEANRVLLESIRKEHSKKNTARVYNIVTTAVYFLLWEIFIILDSKQLYDLKPGLLIHAGVVIASFCCSVVSIFVKHYFFQMLVSIFNSLVLSQVVMFSAFFLDVEFHTTYFGEKMLIILMTFVQLSFVNIPFLIKVSCAIFSCTWFIIASFLQIQVMVMQFFYAGTSVLFIGLTYFIIGNLVVINVRETKLSERSWKNLLDISIQNRQLLNSFLPGFIIKRIIEKRQNEIFDKFDKCSVLFYTLCFDQGKQNDMIQIAVALNEVYVRLDSLCIASQCLKIKSIGSVYVVSSIPMNTGEDDLQCRKRIAELALLFSGLDVQSLFKVKVDFKMGLNHGEVVGGIIGETKYLWDIFGDVVNVASRMSMLCPPNQIQTTQSFKDGTEDEFLFEERGEIAVKGKGNVRTFILMERKIGS